MEAEPVQFLWRRYEECLEPARREVARFVGARPKDLAFVTNATAGVNAVVRSLKLRAGQELLTTNHDYNACHNVLVEAARVVGARVVPAQVPFPLSSPDEVIEAVLNSVNRRTRLVMLDHATSTTGLIFPVSRLVRELEARGIDTLVDGAHAPGMLPLNLSDLCPAYYTANLHKWVCAPKGAGFLWVREDNQKEVHPAIISHGHNTPRPGYTVFQDRFDWAGTFDPTPWMCAGEAIRWLGKLLPGGWPELRSQNHKLVASARRLLCARLEVQPPCPENLLGSMATIPLPARFQGVPKAGRIDAEQLQLYDRFGIEVPFMRFGEPRHRYLRISAQLYNSQRDYEYLAEALARTSLTGLTRPNVPF
jgi:isopenicillin-N epimerase